MPRNGSGTSTVINTFVIDTVADPDEVNANFTDVADQLTNSLPRDGQAGMNAPLPLQNGTNSLPALTFASDTDTGVYRSAANKVGISAGGTVSAVFTANGVEDTVTICDPNDNTKKTRIDAGAITTASTRVMTAPDRDINISAVPKGYHYGLTLSNNVSDPTNDIDIATGEMADDGATPWIIILASSLTKRLDANWAVGTNQGGLDTGSKANNTGYHIWLIQRSDTGVVDALFSLSGTSPTMPTNYDRKVKIGCVITDGAGAIRPFTQYGDRFVLTSTFVAINLSGGSGGNITNNTLTLPTGVRYDVEVAGSVTSASAWAFFLYTPGVTPDVQDLVARGGAGGVSSIGVARILSNTSSQITTAGSVASMTITLALRAWTYPRGV